jgi:alkylated DNA nucleotide flippase Atl1
MRAVRVSKRGDPAGEAMQAQMLRLEGIVFHRGKISLDRYQWRPKG